MLDINGKLRIEANGTQTIRFYDTGGGGSPDEDGRIEVAEDGGGGEMKFYTLETGGGTPQERLSINRRGALGLSTNYGSAGQFLKSNGSGSAVSWDTPTDTTYTNGTGVSISPSNVISIGQSVAVSDSPSFNQMSLGNAGVNQGILNLQDFTNVGTENVAQIKGIKEGTNGGEIQFHTKVDGGSITKKMVIREDGATEIYSDGIGLSILSPDGALQQAQIYHDLTGTQDLIIDTDAPATTTKGISFRTQAGVQRLRIGYFGELGFSPTNDIGTSGQILESRGAGNTPRWVNPSAPAPGAFGVFFVNGTLTIPTNSQQQVNRLQPNPSFTLTGMVLGAFQSSGNTPQTITLNDAGTYLFSWNINAQQLSGSTINEFEIYRNGTRLYNNWYIFSGIENIVGSVMINQATANQSYNFTARASSGGSYRLNGFNTEWTQLSITKLF